MADIRGVAARDLHGAFLEIEAVSRGTKATQPFFSVSINPPEDARLTIEDFRQAAFFFLDWQNFHQKSRKISPYAWDEKAAKGRAIRLAYILSMSNADRSLLEDNAVFSLMQLADFHVQRVTDPVYGAPYDMILSTPEFKALCTVVDLSACAHKR